MYKSNRRFVRKVDSYNSLLLEKASTFHDVIILIKSVFNKGKNNYY